MFARSCKHPITVHCTIISIHTVCGSKWRYWLESIDSREMSRCSLKTKQYCYQPSWHFGTRRPQSVFVSEQPSGESPINPMHAMTTNARAVVPTSNLDGIPAGNNEQVIIFISRISSYRHRFQRIAFRWDTIGDDRCSITRALHELSTSLHREISALYLVCYRYAQNTNRTFKKEKSCLLYTSPSPRD